MPPFIRGDVVRWIRVVVGPESRVTKKRTVVCNISGRIAWNFGLCHGEVGDASEKEQREEEFLHKLHLLVSHKITPFDKAFLQ